MSRFYRRHLLVAVICFLFFWFMLSLVVPETALIEILNVISLSFATSVFVAYAPLSWESLKSEQPDPDDVLTVGIVLVHGSIMVARSVSLLYRTFDLKMIIQTDVVTFGIYLSIMAAICHLNTGSVYQGKVPTKQWVKLGIISGLSIGVLALILQLITFMK